ncbi:MAG TPA: hydantoinase/oxoprolinase family protein [Hyphomicrobiaceae bacterium]|nr:hydantoinase/oxoprolinase family protein [Hyphomicrobiaceae bacterium]
MMSYRLGVDIGGTFTDIVLLRADGKIHTLKVASSVDDYARAILDGLKQLFAATDVTAANIEEIRHGTTVASNAILEKKGARVGLITTEGFRDVLEIRTLRMPRLYDLAWSKPEPLVPRYLRQTVGERIDHRGGIERPLDVADAERAVTRLLAEEVDAIAVCLINSFANPAHEIAIGEVIKRRAPGLPLSVSHQVLPEIKEYERTSTTVINAYVMPVVATYLAALRRRLDAASIAAPLLIMQSNGGLMASAAAIARPMHIIESGPAGGVVGAQALARSLNLAKIITFDMGGTTAKTSIVEAGEVMRAHEYAVGAGIVIGSRLLTGAGYTLKVPAIDLAEVGAGGGSHLWIDAGGSLKVGPQSAGASPGPVCYGYGGDIPTITDANLVLGLINPKHLLGGALPLNAAAAARALTSKIAEPLRLTPEAAAFGAHAIAASNMIRAIKAVSSERGRDPRQCALFAFGGNGPLFACGMARSLGIGEVIVPPAPGLFSSFGLIYADVEHHYSRSLRRRLDAADLDQIEAAWHELEQQALAQLASEGFVGERARLRRSAALNYHGQSFDLVVPVADRRFDLELRAELEEAFGREHARTYGHRAGAEEPVELVSIQVVGQGLRTGPALPAALSLSRGEPAPSAPRRVYFGEALGWLETPILTRSALAEARSGPLIIEEYDATCVVPPGATARLDAGGNIRIEL